MNSDIKKRRYLCKDFQELVKLLYSAPSWVQERVEFLYKEGSLGVICFSFLSQKERDFCEEMLAAYILRDVSEEKYYKRRFLEQFGLFETHDFVIEEVLVRLEALREVSFHFTFHESMSTQKILQVLIYHALVRFESSIQHLSEQQGQESLKYAIKQLKRLIDGLVLWCSLCDDLVANKILQDLKGMYQVGSHKDKILIVKYVQDEIGSSWIAQLRNFLFYDKKKYFCEDLPLGAFMKQYHSKEKNKILKVIKKALFKAD